jgi:hypothetical protein
LLHSIIICRQQLLTLSHQAHDCKRWDPLQVILVGPAEQFAKGSPVNKAVLKAAAAQKGKVIYVLADRDGPDAEPILEFFSLKKDLDAKEPQVNPESRSSRRFPAMSQASC